MSPEVEQAHEVLAELQQWQEVVGEVADSLPFPSHVDRLDWLHSLPRLPPPPAEQLAFVLAHARKAGWRSPTGSLATGKRAQRDGAWQRPASLAQPRKRNAKPQFTDRQLAIAIAVLEAQERTRAA